MWFYFTKHEITKDYSTGFNVITSAPLIERIMLSLSSNRKLISFRFHRSVSQEVVCQRCDLPFNTYRHYEYGDTFPSAKAIVALSRLFYLSPGKLFEQLCAEK